MAKSISKPVTANSQAQQKALVLNVKELSQIVKQSVLKK